MRRGATIPLGDRALRRVHGDYLMRRIHVIARATLERQEDGSIIMELDREVLRKAQWYDGDEVCISLFRGKCLNVILASEVDSMNERTWEHSGTGGTDRFERGF